MCWMNQFFSRNFADLSKMRRRTSISSLRTFFFFKGLFHLRRSSFTPQNILNRNSNYHFIYLPIQVNCKMMCLYYMYVEQLSFSDFVSNIINLTPVNIVTVFNKLEVPITHRPYWSAFGKSSSIFVGLYKFLAVWHGFKLYPWTKNTFTALNTLW